MFTYDFDFFSTKRITLKFNCSECSEILEEIIENIPKPNFDSERDTYSGTLESDITYIECPQCHKQYSIQLGSSMYGAELYSDDLDENTEVEVEYEEDQYFEDYAGIIESNTRFFETFCNQMEVTKKLFTNSALSQDLSMTLYKLVFANIITCLETYLSDALINTVLNNEKYLKRFVENFNDYKSISLNLCDIYKKMENIKKQVRNDLFNLMYHNIPKIKAIYKRTFDIDIPNQIGDIMKKISDRHDLVHRNGKNKDGNQILISKEELNTTYDMVYNFVKDIDNQFNEKVIN